MKAMLKVSRAKRELAKLVRYNTKLMINCPAKELPEEFFRLHDEYVRLEGPEQDLAETVGRAIEGLIGASGASTSLELKIQPGRRGGRFGLRL